MIQSHLRRLCAIGVLFGGGLLAAAEPGTRSVGTKSATPKPARPLVDPAVRVLAEETDIFLKRIQFCTRLRQLAVETREEKYIAQADELEAMADKIFKQRTQGLTVADTGSSARDLDSRLGSGASAESEASLKSRKPNGGNASASRGGN